MPAIVSVHAGDDAAKVNDDRRGTLLLVGVILIAAAALAVILTALMRAPARLSPDIFPAEANGLEVISVTDAIAIQAADDSHDIAVSGWFAPTAPIPCPAPLPPVVPLLDGDCSINFTWLMSAPESLRHASGNTVSITPPSGPAVNPVFDGPDTDWARPADASGEAVPTPVVFIGHFDDARANGCRPEHQQICRDRFVVTVVVWADGVDFP
jgi:hypothetical protein